MKTFTTTVISLASTFVLVFTSLADTWTDSTGITWTYTVSGGKASLGTGSWPGTAIPTSTAGALTIPSSLGGCPVTSIGGLQLQWSDERDDTVELGKVKLTDENWAEVPAGSEGDYNFFKVTVEMK